MYSKYWKYFGIDNEHLVQNNNTVNALIPSYGGLAFSFTKQQQKRK
jgi:hypothetical protein